jgi:MFS family permease
MGSEWLQAWPVSTPQASVRNADQTNQGPYTYSLFHDEKELEQDTVAALYVTAYVAAALSSIGIGFLADSYGRRNTALAFCAIHALSCLSVLSSHILILFVGRLLAGVALTLLWTVFESWMVTEFNIRRLAQTGVSLGTVFGTMTTTNCLTAILGGVVGHCLVLGLDTRVVPFITGIVC